MYWSDETLIRWMQTYQGTKKPIISIFIRRYKNLIFKSLAQQRDPRYNRDDLSQQIILIFIQLLEEYDVNKNIPVAGFLKAKLRHRIFNFFKLQVKEWSMEVLHDIENDGENDNTEINSTNFYEMPTTSELDFWKHVCKYLPEAKFKILYWKYQANYCSAEIAALLNIDIKTANKAIENACDSLKYSYPFLKEYTPNKLTEIEVKKVKKIKHEHILKNNYHILTKIIANACRIVFENKETNYHQGVIKHIQETLRKEELLDMHKIIEMILRGCNLEGDGENVATSKCKREI